MSFKLEVHGCGDPAGAWTSNALRFETRTEAEAYGANLGRRWFGFDASQVTPSDDPVNAVADSDGHNAPLTAGVQS